MQYNKKISVIIAAYNSEQFIEETLQSVFMQDYDNFELIMVDDGSKDDTLKVATEAVEKYNKKDVCIKIIHTENHGVAAARNLGLENATGEWVIFFDSDDVMTTDFLSKLVSRTYDNVDMVAGNALKMDELGNPIGMMEQEYSGLYETMNNQKNLIDMADVSAITGVKMYRKELLDKYNIRIIQVLAEDVAMFLEALYFSRAVYIENEAIMKYRIMAGSMSKNVTEKELSVISMFDEVEKFLAPYDINRAFPYAFYNMKVKVCRIYGLHFTGTKNKKLRKEIFVRFADEMIKTKEQHSEYLSSQRLEDVKRIEKKKKQKYLYLSRLYLMYHHHKWRNNKEVL